MPCSIPLFLLWDIFRTQDFLESPPLTQPSILFPFLLLMTWLLYSQLWVVGGEGWPLFSYRVAPHPVLRP
jgi:hypothetical protein